MKTKKRAITLAFVLVLLVVTVGFAAAMIIPSAEELLTQSLETLETITNGHAVIEATVQLPDETFSGSVELWGKLDVGPNGEPAFAAKILTASKDGLVGITAVTDGFQFWLYDPGRNTVVIGQGADIGTLLAEKVAEYSGEWDQLGNFDPDSMDHPETPAEAVTKLLEYFTAERDGQEEMAGSDAYRLQLIPIPDQMPDEIRVVGGFINLWLRSSDRLPLSIEYAQGAIGYGKIEATMAEINADMDESVFTFVIPDGAEVIEATELLAMLEAQEHTVEAVDFEPLTATDLPEAAVASEIRQLGGASIQHYSLPDGQSFTVAQGAGLPVDPPAEATSTETVQVRGVEGVLFANDDNSRTLLAWSEGDMSFIIGGDLSPEQALAIAESLQ
jgi:outer membrane lipoprotein-sorting protein